jgi:segregation and condensation protein B
MELRRVLESILFSSQKPLTTGDFKEILKLAAERTEEETCVAFKKTREEEIEAALAQLEHEHRQAGHSYQLLCVAGAWQFASQSAFAPWVKALAGEKNRPPRLTQPGLETLAIIAYRQPVTRAEIEQIRGVSVDGVMQTLNERGLIEQVGRAEVAGRPITYGTTPLFLEYFGLRNLDELPAADELRRIVVEKPESLLTVESGLATPPPGELRENPSSSDSSNAGDSTPSPQPEESSQPPSV